MGLWLPGDTIVFTLPIEVHLTKYTGVDRLEGHDRYYFEYGPLLMAAVGAAETSLRLVASAGAEDLLGRLRRVSKDSLRFTAPLLAVEWRPYYEVDAESFSCFPVIESTSSVY
jgi:hypothetical protein